MKITAENYGSIIEKLRKGPYKHLANEYDSIKEQLHPGALSPELKTKVFSFDKKLRQLANDGYFKDKPTAREKFDKTGSVEDAAALLSEMRGDKNQYDQAEERREFDAQRSEHQFEQVKESLLGKSLEEEAARERKAAHPDAHSDMVNSIFNDPRLRIN